ncbi:MAG: anthrone oxygenase family protein [Actinomycetota bacterium]
MNAAVDPKQILLTASVVATGLMAGLFYGWSVSVIPGTRRLASTDYVALMQHINREILTPRFLVPFVGIPLLLGAAALTQFRAGDQRRGILIAASAGTYLVGVFGVTAARNVPLNEALDAFDLAAADRDAIDRRRTTYENPWNRWNTVRAIANVASFSLVAAAAVISERAD